MDREHKSIDIAEFIANASQIVDELGRGTVQEFHLTRDGQVVASVRAPRHRLHGHLRGLVELPPGFDLTKPIFEDRFHAEDGRVHE